jgi:hypothetical protein
VSDPTDPAQSGNPPAAVQPMKFGPPNILSPLSDTTVPTNILVTGTYDNNGDIVTVTRTGTPSGNGLTQDSGPVANKSWSVTFTGATTGDVISITARVGSGPADQHTNITIGAPDVGIDDFGDDSRGAAASGQGSKTAKAKITAWAYLWGTLTAEVLKKDKKTLASGPVSKTIFRPGTTVWEPRFPGLNPNEDYILRVTLSRIFSAWVVSRSARMGA